MTRVTNREAGSMAHQKLVFENKNKTLYAKWIIFTNCERIEALYFVFSYGEHWPLYIYDKNNNVWYGNQDKYGVTTSRHASQTMPVDRDQIRWRPVATMRELARNGMSGFVRKQIVEAA